MGAADHKIKTNPLGSGFALGKGEGGCEDNKKGKGGVQSQKALHACIMGSKKAGGQELKKWGRRKIAELNRQGKGRLAIYGECAGSRGGKGN